MHAVLHVLSNSRSELTIEVKRFFCFFFCVHTNKLDTLIFNKCIFSTEMDVTNIQRRVDEENQTEELNEPDFESVIEDSEENYNNIPIAYR